jgi:hypothetical protein
MSATPAAGDEDSLTRLNEVVEHFAGAVIVDDCSGRHLDLEILAIAPTTITAFAVPSTLCAERMIELEFQQRVFMSVRFHEDASAVAAVAATWTAAWHEFLAPESNATVAAIARLDCNFGFVDKHLFRSQPSFDRNRAKPALQ